ncbi:diguanylate cyclase domain-containing protein [Agrobacterium sp.]|uniref:diguanylate cyclase domain-containing protein n=1 Tax=Agrobacterium sp. TaxID=361 RepID=UPI0028A64735|nr:diguanylate cyclase [Agrobacterium sp.]
MTTVLDISFLRQSSGFADADQLLGLINHLPNMVFVKDTNGRFIFANSALREYLGLTSEEALHDLNEADFLPERSVSKVLADEARVLETGEPTYDVEECFSIHGGPVCWLSTTKLPLRDERGRITGLVAISRDITESKRQDTIRRGSAALFEMIARSQPLDMILHSLTLLVESMVEGICASVLLFEQETGKLRHGAAPSLPEAYTKLIDGITFGPKVGSCGTAAWRNEPVVVEDIANSPLWQDYVEIAERFDLRSCWSTPIMDANRQVLGTFALYSGEVRKPSAHEKELIDMATSIASIAIDRWHKEERVRYMAHHDPLTGLSNRTLFWTQFNRALHEAKRENRMVAITYLDLDDFKQVNDLFGHAAGDEVLCRVADRIVSCIRASDIAVRLGGDEFALVFSNPKHDEDGVRRRLADIRQKISMPIDVEGACLKIDCSLGVAFYPQHGQTAEDLLAAADVDMYRAKKAARNRLTVLEIKD